MAAVLQSFFGPEFFISVGRAPPPAPQTGCTVEDDFYLRHKRMFNTAPKPRGQAKLFGRSGGSVQAKKTICK